MVYGRELCREGQALEDGGRVTAYDHVGRSPVSLHSSTSTLAAWLVTVNTPPSTPPPELILMLLCYCTGLMATSRATTSSELVWTVKSKPLCYILKADAAISCTCVCISSCCCSRCVICLCCCCSMC